ncbi:hypothetical protein [Zooshikella ganghwensis]|uniref:Uncharacterized protein n=1 Tax=Zooshikella ganghwensis TaxID=202772 RepID=A0A4P9VK80_9GAMM|nr:hypothetical protein [Zooshikella ganghwensis]RDH42744.1 hypothetical protein B9G39_04365 [Zooshikella ganghwensis]
MKPRELILISDCGEERRQQTLKLIREGYKPLNSEEGFIPFSSANIQQVGKLTALKTSDELLRADKQPLKALHAGYIDTIGNTP